MIRENLFVYGTGNFATKVLPPANTSFYHSHEYFMAMGKIRT